MSLNKNKIVLYFLLLISVASFSQDKKEKKKDSIKLEKLEEVIITATRTVRQLSTLPLPVQLITQKDIKLSNSLRLGDILNEQTGLITVPNHGQEGIQLQGLDSQYTLILIDGVPLIGRLAGTLDIDRVAVANAKQIEIVKGPSSSLYGSEAIGGVINIITEEPKSGFHGDINQRVGSLSTFDSNINLSYKKNKFGINVFTNRYSSEGYDIDKTGFGNTVDPYFNYTVNTKVIYNATDKTKFTLSGRYFTQNQDNIPTSNLRGEGKINEWNLHFKADHNFNDKWSGNLEFYTTQYQTEQFLNNLDGSRNNDSFYNQFLIRPEVRIEYEPNKNNSFFIGAGLTHETIDRTYFSIKPEFNSPYVYVQYDTKPLEKLNIIIGTRFDGHNKYESKLNPKLSFRYKFNDKLAIKGSAGFAYKTPDFRQLYLDFTNPLRGYTVLGYNVAVQRLQELANQGQLTSASLNNLPTILNQFNNDLKPESSIGYNIGLDFTLNNQLRFNLNLFRNDLTNMINTRAIANKTNGQMVFSYSNINKAYTQGVEFNTTWKPHNQIKISGGYQLLYAKDKAAEEAFRNGQAFANNYGFPLKESQYFGLPNRSRHMANIKVFYEIPKWKVNTNIRGTYRSKYGLYDTNGTLRRYLDDFDEFVEGHTIWDVAINKTIFKNYIISLGVDNIFDFTKSPNTSVNRLSISNLPGRLIYGKLNIQI